MTETHDPFERLDALERRWAVVPVDQIWPRWLVLAVTAAMFVLLSLILGGLYRVTTDTRAAVDAQVVPLQEQVALQADRIAELEEAVADSEAVIMQTIEGLLLYGGLLRDAGIDPPPVVLLPPEEGD
jgi:uncharacterized coiled-coil protein SlyX